MAATVQLESLLISKPGVKGGALCLAGTGIKVAYVGTLYAEGMTPEQIRDELSNVVSLESVYAAIAYYIANREAIDAQIRAEDDEQLRVAAEWKAAGRIR